MGISDMVIQDFSHNRLIGIKARDFSVRSWTKVAVLGRFEKTGRVRPGFKVNMMSTEGVGGTSQVIRFENRDDADRWINQNWNKYNPDYTEDDFDFVNSRSGSYVKLPLCDFDVDVWVNSVWLDRVSESTEMQLREYCPQYFTGYDNDGSSHNSNGQYRGFRF